MFEPLEDRRMMSTTIAFLDDPGYVNTASGSDANNLLAQLQSTGAYTIKPFAGTSAASFTAGLSGANVLVVPALDQGDLGGNLSPQAIGVIDQFVSGGGGLVITGDATKNFAGFLNDVFGYAVVEGGPGIPYHITGAADGTDFANGPASLAGNTNQTGLVISSLPSGSENVYDAYYDINATGVLMPYGSNDSVCFLGWDWTNGGPGGSQADGDWNSVLQTAITQVANQAPVVQATVTTLSATAQTLSVGQSFDFNVTVSPASASGLTPTGTVTFFEGGANKGTFNLVNGQLTQSFTADTPGDSTFDVVYNGDSNFTASTSNDVSQTYLPASTAVGKITHYALPSDGVSGQPYSAKTTVVFTNSGPTLRGSFQEQLYLDAASDGLSTEPVSLISKLVKITLAKGKKLAASFSLRVLPESVAPGTYHLVAEISDPLGDVDFVTLPNTVTVADPVVSLVASVAQVKPATVKANKSASLTITITNTGNIKATGPLLVSLSPSSDGVSPDPDVAITVLNRRVTLKPGKPGKYVVHFKLPLTLAGGSYFPFVNVSLDGASTTAVGSTAFVVG